MKRRIPVLKTSPKVWRLLGPALYSECPLLAITMRELFQNARDACLTAGRDPEIVMELQTDAQFTRGQLFCDDDGVGMDEDTILDRFLVLGESKKSAGSTGGFGIAKATILGACAWWEVRTRDLYVSFDHVEEGRPIDVVEPRTGTRVTLRYEPPGDDRQSRAIRLDGLKFARGLSWLAHSDTGCVVRACLEGRPVQEWRLHGLKLDEFEPVYCGESGRTRWALYQLDPIELAPLEHVWMSQECSEPIRSAGYVFYRANGLVQFSRLVHYDHPHCFVVEVVTEAQPGEPDYPFTPSRENLVGDVDEDVEETLKGHKQNPITSASIHRHRGEKKDTVLYDGELMGRAEARRRGREKRQARLLEETTGEVRTALRHSSIAEVSPPPKRLGMSPLGVRLLLKGLSKTRRNVLLSHNLRLLEVWARVVDLVMEANGVEEQFGIGFVFDTDTVAERHVSSEGLFYLLNPRGLATTRPGEALLVMLIEACHEIAHGEHSYHTEAFSVYQGALFRGATRLFRARRRGLERMLAGRESKGDSRLALPGSTTSARRAQPALL